MAKKNKQTSSDMKDTGSALPAAPKAEVAKPRRSPGVKAKKAPAKKAKKSAAKTPPVVEPSDDEIRIRAYFISERRHRLNLPGDSSADWIEARRQLVSEGQSR